MPDAALALHTAIYQRLRDGLSVPVYDGMPNSAPLPYVALDFADELDQGLLRDRLSEHLVYVSVWSERRGQAEVLDIMSAIDGLVHNTTLELSAGRLVQLRVNSKSTRRDQDGETFSGEVRLRAMTTF